MRNDQIFTPEVIVQQMLDMIEYHGANLHKTIFEPSFGSGNFLCEIVHRILDYTSDNNTVLHLLDNIHGCELSQQLYNITINRLNSLLSCRGITYSWDNLICGDALDYPARKFDYVVGNPPYIRIHDLPQDVRNKTKSYKYASGMTDLYVVFFELGLSYLKDNGELIYITPNSFLKNTSQKTFRRDVSKYVKAIYNYESYPVFEGVSTYTCITHIAMQHRGDCKYVRMKNATATDFSLLADIGGKDTWVFPNPSDQTFIDALSCRARTLGELCDIRNGVATNADRVYIDVEKIEPAIQRPAIKASTLAFHTILFPYTNNADVMPEHELSQKYPLAYQYLCDNKTSLLKRDMEYDEPFYRYARSQGLTDINHPKFVLQHIIAPDAERCSFVEVSDSTIVYGGMFIIAKESHDIPYIRDILSSEEFCRYMKIMGKDMSGGYKAVSTKVVKSYPVE